MTRLRTEAGFSLPELMIAMSISLVTLLVVLGVLDLSIKQSNAVAGRVSATQTSRIAMDTITRQLRSQVCYSSTVPALVSGTDDDAVIFHADLSDGATPIEQRKVVFDETTETIREQTWPGTGSPLAFPTMTRDRLLLEEVVRRPAPNAAIFRYYAYGTASPPKPDVLLPTPLNATDRARTAKIDIGFVTLPPGVKSTDTAAAAAVTLQNEIYVRVADPNDPAPTPICA